MRQPAHIVAAFGLVLILALGACATAPTTPTAAPAGASPAATRTGATPAAVGPAAEKPAPSAEAPKYGGKVTLAQTSDTSTWEDYTVGGSASWASSLPNQELWTGDWTKGNAGGYGSKETDWGTLGYDVFAHKTGSLAESWKIDIDNATQMATVVYQIRQGVRFALDPNNEASRLVGGRELTADDVLAAMKQVTTDTKAYLYRSNPELRNIDVSKTGPNEITVKVPVNALVTALSRLSDNMRIYPAELNDKTGDWKNHVGTGPFMLANYVAGSSVDYVKNPNYWMKDPVGPGKGNQLPYIDEIQVLVITDPSTRLAAFRTGKLDVNNSVPWEDREQIQKQFPQLLSAPGGHTGPAGPFYMRTDKPPYNDKRVRHALMMATDFNTIKKQINGGLGEIVSFPFDYYKEYAGLYVRLDDPDVPAVVKDIYTYNPEKAKKLLAEAGYPNGFKASVMITSSESSYAEMIAAMWSKVGVELAIDVKDAGVRTSIVNSQGWDHFTTGPGKAPVAIYYSGNIVNGVPSAQTNLSFVDDPKVKDLLPKIRTAAATDEKEAFKLARELTKHALEEAWAIPTPNYRGLRMWWPWLKHYSGEDSVGYYNFWGWTQYAWVDQEMKKSMGY